MVKVFMGSSQDRVLRHLLSFQLVLQMTLFKGFFRTFSPRKKVRSAGQVIADLPRHVSSWTLAACGQRRGSDEEKTDELLAVPIQLRTPAQWARLREYYELSDEDVVPARGSRPPCLGEPREPQDRDQQRTVEQTAEYAPMVQILDAPVAQMVDRPLVLLAAFEAGYPSAQDVDAYPLPSHGSLRAADSGTVGIPQCRLSLIDVIRHPVEQTVGGGRIGGLPGFLQGQSCSLSAEQIVDNPVPRRGFGGGLLGLHPGQSSSAFYGADHRVAAATAEQNVDIPAPRGAPHDFHQNPLPAAGSADLPETTNQGGFSHFFPFGKKCKNFAHPGVGTGRGLQLMASVSLAGGIPVCSGTDGSTGFMEYNMG